MNEPVLERVRRICLALPEVNERSSHGTPTFFVQDRRTFVTFADNHHNDGRIAIWCHAPEGMQSALVEQDPDRFFMPPYVGHRGWIGVRLEGDVDWGIVTDLIHDAYRGVAPRTLVAALDNRS